MNKFTGLLFSLLSLITASVTLLNLWVLLILIFHAVELDLNAWVVVFGRLCVVTLFGFATFKAFRAGKKRLFGSVQNLASMTVDSSMQQPVIGSITVTRSITLLIGYWIVFAVAAILAFFWAVLLIPAFQDLYPSFGADLPGLTLAVIKYRFALFVFPLIVLIPAVFVSIERTVEKQTCTNYKIGLAVFVASLCIALVAVVVALYLPIFRLGQTY